MKLLSLNVGTPQKIDWLGKTMTTSIFKKPVAGRQEITFLTIKGDYQSDKKSHGGFDKAIYSYSVEYYDYWKTIIKRDDWVPGMFGENLTTSGLKDSEAKVGSIYRIGTAKLMPVQPRFPCQTLCARFGLKEMIDLFYNGGRHGIYYKVVEEGHLEVNDEIELIEESKYDLTISDLVECKVTKGQNKEKLNRILEIPFLPAGLKTGLQIYKQ